MTVTQQIITIAITAIATIITRFLPFAVFQSKKTSDTKIYRISRKGSAGGGIRNAGCLLP